MKIVKRNKGNETKSVKHFNELLGRSFENITEFHGFLPR